ncbi:MAG TPA: squalene cyclase, partial [Terrimesophilobacter sp.]|nr:squalene cyclase [Terrimesophilobacter sp.]
EYEVATGGTPQLREARHAAEEYLLSRRLLYRASTGELVGWWVDRFAYPFRWFHSALNAVNYFRDASLHDGSELDERITDAVELIREARTGDGRWLQGRRHPGRVWFEVDVDAGEPSQWLTFYAMRVLDWWDST